MFLVNKEDKTTQEIKDISFKSCGLKERDDLQEWISNNPMILGEELLIIQKEFENWKSRARQTAMCSALRRATAT